MIAELKPYPKYKPSSHAWLGDLPQHWSLMPNRALFAEVKKIFDPQNIFNPGKKTGGDLRYSADHIAATQ